ncbi:hypothetical protein [Brevundimonas sp.]|uniref:hypothetical protein n=1 Tax=Brevundimonas sp. TaxID=1871086 RepID=UPI0024899DFD|nr:hypothetical protein [Brevundimonas sp.]MDI1281641.1 hypothetical protein [Brevundimonas sp.]
MSLLSVVVIVQSAALAWLLLVSPDRHQVRADLARDPVPTLVTICTAPLPKPDGKAGYKF